jgi:hypothetical protein
MQANCQRHTAHATATSKKVQKASQQGKQAKRQTKPANVKEVREKEKSQSKARDELRP